MSDLCRGPIEPAPRRKIPPAQVEQNWLVGLAPPVLIAPFVQTAEYSYRLPQRRLRQDDVSRDWLLAVAPTIPAVPLVRAEFDPGRRPRVALAEDWLNLQTSTLAGTAAAQPFVQSATDYYFPTPRRIRRSVDDSIDWMTIETAAPVAPLEWSSLRVRVIRADDAQNLLLTTLAAGQAGTAPFVQTIEYSYSWPRRARGSIEAERDWLLAVAPTVPAVPPVAPDLPYTRAARPQRFDQWPNLQLTTFSIVTQSASYPPFELPAARRALTQRFDDHPNLLLTTFNIVTSAPIFAPFDLPLAPRARAQRGDDTANLLLTMLSAQPFSSIEPSESRKARALRIDDSSNLLLMMPSTVTQQPFSSIDLSAFRKARQPAADDAANLLLGTFSIVPQAVLPFASGEWPVPKIRRPYGIEASLNLTLTTLAIVQVAPPPGETLVFKALDDRRITITLDDRRLTAPRKQ